MYLFLVWVNRNTLEAYIKVGIVSEQCQSVCPSRRELWRNYSSNRNNVDVSRNLFSILSHAQGHHDRTLRSPTKLGT